MIRASSLLCLFLLVGCGSTDSEPVEGVRIVSLSPSITATVSDIGLSDMIIGRSAFCKSVDASTPVVGDIYQIDYERLLRLAPSHVLVQETSAKMDQHLSELAGQGHFSLYSWRVNRLEDIQQLHNDLLQVFEVDNLPLQVEILQSTTHLAMPILVMTPGSESATGLCFGTETYLGDLLEMMGCTNALQTDGWVLLSLEDIGKLNPAVILVVSDSPITISRGIRSLDIPVIEFIDDDVLIPSSKIVDMATRLQHALARQ